MQEAQEIWVRSLGQEDPLEKEMATHFSILAWEITWTEEPNGLQSMGPQESDMIWQLNHRMKDKSPFLCSKTTGQVSQYSFFPNISKWSGRKHFRRHLETYLGGGQRALKEIFKKPGKIISIKTIFLKSMYCYWKQCQNTANKTTCNLIHGHKFSFDK